MRYHAVTPAMDIVTTTGVPCYVNIFLHTLQVLFNNYKTAVGIMPRKIYTLSYLFIFLRNYYFMSYTSFFC